MEEGAEAPSEARTFSWVRRPSNRRNGGGRRSALGGPRVDGFPRREIRPQWRRAQKRPRSTRVSADPSSGSPPQWRRAQKRPRSLCVCASSWTASWPHMEEGAEAPSEAMMLKEGAIDEDAAMEEGAEAPSEGSRFIPALTWGFAPFVRAVGLAAWLWRLSFGCQGA